MHQRNFLIKANRSIKYFAAVSISIAKHLHCNSLPKHFSYLRLTPITVTLIHVIPQRETGKKIQRRI